MRGTVYRSDALAHVEEESGGPIFNVSTHPTCMHNFEESTGTAGGKQTIFFHVILLWLLKRAFRLAPGIPEHCYAYFMMPLLSRLRRYLLVCSLLLIDVVVPHAAATTAVTPLRSAVQLRNGRALQHVASDDASAPG